MDAAHPAPATAAALSRPVGLVLTATGLAWREEGERGEAALLPPARLVLTTAVVGSRSPTPVLT